MSTPLVPELRNLARAGHTQASAAREASITRERVRQLANDHGIQFKSNRNHQPNTPPCKACGKRLLIEYPKKCLACYWTPKAIAGFRKRLRQGQIEFSFTLGMGAITVARWEAGKITPSNRGLMRLEALREEVRKK